MLDVWGDLQSNACTFQGPGSRAGSRPESGHQGGHAVNTTLQGQHTTVQVEMVSESGPNTPALSMPGMQQSDDLAIVLHDDPGWCGALP